MNTYALTRIVGNELPPRDAPGNCIKSLKFILENEPPFFDCTKIWVINQVHSVSLKHEIINLLGTHRIEILDFDKKKFLKSHTFDEKIVAAININKARNLGIDASKEHEFTFLFDGDCFFTQELWDFTTSQIEADQKISNRKYYGVPGVRTIEGKIPTNLFSEKQWEPSLVFRHDAELRFNELVPFFQGEKLELMKKIGYSSKSGDTRLNGKMCKNVGCLIHVSFNEENSETSLEHRMNLRHRSIQLLIEQLTKEHGISLM